MTAKFITWVGETILLIAATPDWRKMEVVLTLPSAAERASISKRESRRNYGRSMRYTFTYSAYLAPFTGEANELRIALDKWNAETVAVPLWPDAVELAANAGSGATTLTKTADMPVRYGAEWLVIAADRSIFELVFVTGVTSTTVTLQSPGLVNAWPAGTLMYPLIFGRFLKQPEITSLTDESGQLEIALKENSTFARRLNPTPETLQTVGSNVPGFSTTRLWTTYLNFVRPLDHTEIELVFNEIGFGRQETIIQYNHPIARGMELEFYGSSRDAIATIENFFVDRRATTLSFMIPSFRGELRLTQDLPISGNNQLITIEPNEYSDAGRSPHPGDPYLALVDLTDPTNITIDPQQVTIVSAGNLSLQGHITVSHPFVNTIVSALLLARFAEPVLTWNYLTDSKAQTRIKFIELPNEYTTPSPVLREPVLLYYFVEQTLYPQISLFTSYEAPFTVPSGTFAGTYAPANFGVKTLQRSLDLSAQKMELLSGKFNGNPLQKFYPRTLEGPLMLTLLEANAANPSEGVKVWFNGEVTKPDPTLRTAECIPFASAFRRKFPAFLVSSTDNYALFDAPLGLDPNAYKVTGPITVISSNQITILSSAGYSLGIDYFANGFIKTSSGATYESRCILRAALVTGGKLRLTLDYPLNHAIVGQTVDMYPGYNGTIDQLESRFNARNNFGGHPFVPDTPPNIKAVKAKQVAGGKKG